MSEEVLYGMQIKFYYDNHYAEESHKGVTPTKAEDRRWYHNHSGEIITAIKYENAYQCIVRGYWIPDTEVVHVYKLGTFTNMMEK